MKTRRTLTALLALMLMAASCGDTTDSIDTSAPDTSSVTSAEETGIALNIQPEDNGGLEYRIISTAYASYEYAVEEENGEIVNDATYRRNSAVEELLGIKFSYMIGAATSGANDEAKELNKLLETSILAEDDSFDLIASTVVTTLPIAVNGFFADINAETSIDLSNPWWVTTLSDEVSINGKLYGVMGDLSLSLYKDICVVYFNKSLLDEYKLEDPYALVRDGKWTLDKYLELAQNGGADLDGNGVIDPAVDQLWNVGQMVPNRAFFTAFNLQILDREGDKISFLSLPEALSDVCSKLYPFFSSNYTYVDPTGDHKLYAGYFNSGRALFMNSYLYLTDYLRDMEDDFGIIPYPKLNEQQDQYYSQLGTSSTMNFIPVTSTRIPLTSKVLEALAYYGKQEVVPAYYEYALKEKYTRDEEVKEMLDLVRSGASMNFTFAHAGSFRNPYPNAIMNFRPGETHYEQLASWYETRVTVWNADLEKLLEGYSD